MVISIMKFLTSLLLLVPLAIAGSYPITGARSGGIQPRREIRDLQFNFPNQFNMYILALRAFQAQKQDSGLSYYRIQGIHGVPNDVWNGVKHTANGQGYCVHDSNLFPTWHRPYIALFEQRLQRLALNEARKFKGPQRNAMLAAARKLRAPYFDWAVNPGPGKPSWPTILGRMRISVRTHAGPQTVHNPLYSYHYHPLDAQWYYPPWNTFRQTLRWPTGRDSGAKSQNSLVDRTLVQQRPGTKYTLFQFFTNCKSWLEISNDQKANSHPGCATSLESLHNNLHNFIGGTAAGQQGHMTIIPYSAHDPSFMLHHTQIDRLLAMWQEVYPTHWIPRQAQKDTNSVTAAGTVMGKDSPLKPFHCNKKGDFWTSDKARHTSALKYTYPELLHGGSSVKGMRARIRKLYGPNSSAHAASPHHKIKRRDLSDELWYETGEEALPEILRREEQAEEAAAATAAVRDEVKIRDLPSINTPLIANNGSSYEYIANIQTTRYGLGGSYNIYLFLSDPTDPNPSTWAYDPNVVGAYGVWSEPGKENANVVSTSSIPLTLALTDRVTNGVLSALSQLIVVPFLTSKLQWKIVGPDGAVLDPKDVPDFEISVVSSTLQPATSDDEFPTWSPFFELPEITKGKAGGSLGGALGGLLGGIGLSGDGN